MELRGSCKHARGGGEGASVKEHRTRPDMVYATGDAGLVLTKRLVVQSKIRNPSILL